MKILLKIKQIFGNLFIYTTWKDNDRYPAVVYHNKFVQKLSEISGYSIFRVHFWSFFAKRKKYFAGFYNGENQTGNVEIDELFSKGYLLKENFLNDDVHKKYSDIFQTEVDRYLNSDSFKRDERNQIRTSISFREYNMRDFELEFKKLLLPLVKDCYGEIKPTFRYELEVSKDGSDYESAFTKWHPDRLVPSLKSLYFPLGVDIAPFSYIQGSQIIDKDWLKISKFFRSIKNYELISKKTMVLKNEARLTLNEAHKAGIRELNNLLPNTFYLGAHHGLHRKKPFDAPGYRFHITVEFTYDYTKFSLIKDGLKGFISFNNSK